MVKIELKRPIETPDGDRSILRPGIHHLKDETFSHWFIQGLVEAGDVVVLSTTPSLARPKILPKAESKPRESEVVIKPIKEEVKVEEINPKVEVKVTEEVKPKRKRAIISS